MVKKASVIAWEIFVEHIQFQSVLFKLLTQIFVMIMKSLIVIENGWLEKYIFDSKRFPTSALKRSIYLLWRWSNGINYLAHLRTVFGWNNWLPTFEFPWINLECFGKILSESYYIISKCKGTSCKASWVQFIDHARLDFLSQIQIKIGCFQLMHFISRNHQTKKKQCKLASLIYVIGLTLQALK